MINYRRLSEKFVYAQHKVRKFDTRVVLPMSEEPWTGCRAHVSRIRDQKDDHHRKHSARDDAPRGVEYLSECLIDFTIAEFPFLYYRYYSTDDNAFLLFNSNCIISNMSCLCFPMHFIIQLQRHYLLFYTLYSTALFQSIRTQF